MGTPVVMRSCERSRPGSARKGRGFLRSIQLSSGVTSMRIFAPIGNRHRRAGSTGVRRPSVCRTNPLPTPNGADPKPHTAWQNDLLCDTADRVSWGTHLDHPTTLFSSGNQVLNVVGIAFGQGLACSGARREGKRDLL